MASSFLTAVDNLFGLGSLNRHLWSSASLTIGADHFKGGCSSEALVAAKHMTAIGGMAQMATSSLTYVHFMFERHEVILADGAWSESF